MDQLALDARAGLSSRRSDGEVGKDVGTNYRAEKPSVLDGHTRLEGDRKHPIPTDNDEDADSGSEDTPLLPGIHHPSNNPTKRKIRDNLNFSQWIQDQRVQIEQSISAQSIRATTQSVTWLARQAKSERIINTPREYQIELFEKAKGRNIIAVLDTGIPQTHLYQLYNN